MEKIRVVNKPPHTKEDWMNLAEKLRGERQEVELNAKIWLASAALCVILLLYVLSGWALLLPFLLLWVGMRLKSDIDSYNRKDESMKIALVLAQDAEKDRVDD